MCAISSFSHFNEVERCENSSCTFRWNIKEMAAMRKLYLVVSPNFGILINDGNDLIFSVGVMTFENDPPLSHPLRSRPGRELSDNNNTEGAILVTDNRVLNGPLGRSLRSFARTAHSALSLRSAPLCYARFARSLRSRARSLTSLTPSWDS